MRAKYGGFCKRCGGPIRPGDGISRTTSGTSHSVCPMRSDTAALRPWFIAIERAYLSSKAEPHIFQALNGAEARKILQDRGIITTMLFRCSNKPVLEKDDAKEPQGSDA